MSGRLGKLAGGCLAAAALLLSLLGPPGWLPMPLSTEAAYRYHEEWEDYLAPKNRCPGGEDTEAPVAEQEATMLCLINWARDRRGLNELSRSPLLMRSAELKSASLVRCDEFTHPPCRNAADLEPEAVGYVRAGSAFGENLAFGGGEAGAARPILDGWLASPRHRHNIFRANWREQAIALQEASDFAGSGDVLLWVSHFGHR